MEQAFQSKQRVGDIVAAFPGASNVFKTYGIDFCCGGGLTLGEALRRRDIPEQPFLAELQRAYDQSQRRLDSAEIDWREAPFDTLVDQIVTEHHGYLRQELPLLNMFVNKIAHVHGDRHPELLTLVHLFRELKAELEPHLAAEETHLFPLIRAYAESCAPEGLARATAALAELEQEHELAGQLLAAMRQATKGYLLPEDACRTYTITFEKLEGLESDLFSHIHLENNILFQRLRRTAEATR